MGGIQNSQFQLTQFNPTQAYISQKLTPLAIAIKANLALKCLYRPYPISFLCIPILFSAASLNENRTLPTDFALETQNYRILAKTIFSIFAGLMLYRLKIPFLPTLVVTSILMTKPAPTFSLKKPNHSEPSTATTQTLEPEERRRQIYEDELGWHTALRRQSEPYAPEPTAPSPDEFIILPPANTSHHMSKSDK
ncbi:MAG: hypothetical protein ACOYK9_00710 [Chlamydiia bacterium]